MNISEKSEVKSIETEGLNRKKEEAWRQEKERRKKMSKSGEERRKFDAETNFLYGIYAYSVQKSMTLQKLAF